MSSISSGNEAWDDYRKCRAGLNFEIDFGVNGAIGTIVTKWDHILFGLWIVFIHNIFFLNMLHSPLRNTHFS